MGAHADMFVPIDQDPRTRVAFEGDERTLLVGFLRWQRETLELKCTGLGPDQLAERAVPPSTMSLLGLVRHMAEVERAWFRRCMSAQDAPRIYCTPDDVDADFDGAVGDAGCVADAFARWREEVAYADEVVAAAPDLDITGVSRSRGPVSLRWVLLHMIEEYARHLGHADLLRERLDGALGV